MEAAPLLDDGAPTYGVPKAPRRRLRRGIRALAATTLLGAAVIGTSFGVLTHLRALRNAGVEVHALVGPEPGMGKEERYLKKVIRCTGRGWEFEANQRYREELLKKLGLDVNGREAGKD